jgi:TatD DNase family protein
VIDAHAHVQAEAFAGDLPAVLQRAALAGVTHILVPGWDVASSDAALTLSREHASGTPRLAAAAGIHPHAASGADEGAWAALEALAADPSVVAVGETGLDYDRMFSPRAAQLANLRRHLALALRLAKPVILHCRSTAGRRDAQDDLIGELERAGVGGPTWGAAFGPRPPAVLHSYSGPPDYAERALALGLAVSFSGLVFRQGEEASAAVARLVPPDRLLVETDAPYLSPSGAPRRRNEPAFVGLTAAWLAEQRMSEVASLGGDLARSYERLFLRDQLVTGSLGTS